MALAFPGMAMLYPTLGEAVADPCEPFERAGVLDLDRSGVFGSAVGALGAD